MGGPPCQAFSTVSIAKWKSLGIPGTIQHPLNRLYAEFLRLVVDVSPSFFVMENVQRMMSVKQGSVKQAIPYSKNLVKFIAGNREAQES